MAEMSHAQGFPTVDDIAKMILNQTEESANLDFKKTLDLSKKAGEKGSNATKQDIVRDVAAFANGVGGTIIVGVSDEGNPDHATGWGHVTPEEASRIEEVVEDSCGQSIDPKVVRLTVHRDKVAETALVIITIPESRELHAVQLDGAVEYWTRPDKKKRRMTALEIRNAMLVSYGGAQAAAATPPGYRAIASALGEAMEAAGERPTFFMAISPSRPQLSIWDLQLGKFRESFTRGADPSRPEMFATYIAGLSTPDAEGLAFRNGRTGLHIRDDGVVTWRLTLSTDLMLTMCPDRKTVALLPSALESAPLSLLQLYYRIATKYSQPHSLLVQLCLVNIETVRLFRLRGDLNPSRGSTMLDTEDGISFYGKQKLVVPSTGPLEFDDSSSPDQVAFQLIRRIYSAFGHGEDAIPDWDPKEERFNFLPYD
jgi:hypothetical protein